MCNCVAICHPVASSDLRSLGDLSWHLPCLSPRRLEEQARAELVWVKSRSAFNLQDSPFRRCICSDSVPQDQNEYIEMWSHPYSSHKTSE